MAKLTPAQIQRSISPEALMSFEDGRSYKTLRPHLTRLGLTPDAYREKWGLPQNYPMVAQTYSDHRSRRAKGIGFGQKSRDALKDLKTAGQNLTCDDLKYSAAKVR